ncbi:MAG: hypothetical protein Q9198_010358, partial [Flavoplaca austrocitrina]
RTITTTPIAPRKTETINARLSPPRRPAAPVKGEGAGAPPGAVTVPLGDPGTPCTPVGAAAMLVDADEERLLATLAVAVASAD